MSEEEKKKVYIPFVGDIQDYVGRSPWDFYSWGHIDMGIAAFIFFSLFITIPEFIFGPGGGFFPWWLAFLLTILVGILWEIVENTVIYYLGWRPGGKDSALNAAWDMIFVTIGGGVMWLFQWLIMEMIDYQGRWFYTVAFTSFFIILICYLIGFYITNENTEKARQARAKSIS
ncbi:MAG: conserved membrane protein of unknown function [Promethearchaeota archaeon]|nr:MAG: conserved membrane protein of unknown function [Candidatus Lokiarchaeota archaeon]